MKSKNPSVDIIVGLPSYNEYDSIAHTAARVDKGLATYFPDVSARIVNVDNSPDTRTKEAFLRSHTKHPKHYIHTSAAHGHKGTNLKKLFTYFLSTNAKALMIIDADVMSNDPIWVKFLCDPIMSGTHDHIFPLYRRHQFDGSITNFVCYPMVKGVLGQAIRQPIGGEMAFSRKAVEKFLAYHWPASARRYGVDIFMTLVSIFSRMRLGTVYLGVKRHKPSGPKLESMFFDVVETLLAMLRSHEREWKKSIQLFTYPMLNNIYKQARNGKLEIDSKRLVSWARRDLRKENQTLQSLVDPILLARLERRDGMYLTDQEWVELVYRILRAPKTYSSARLARALRPLYFIRFLTYCSERPKNDYAGSMRIIEHQSDLFFEKRNELII